MKSIRLLGALVLCGGGIFAAEDFPKPYSAPCLEREEVFEFTERPTVRRKGEDLYEITFAVKGNCDVTVGIVDPKGTVVRHLGSGVLGANAPAPFQKNALRQTLSWNGKDDLDDYVKEPEKMRVRVMLGLKPEFDKLLLGNSPKNLPGKVWGIAVGPEGAYVFAKGQHLSCRRFDHDGNYLASLLPPPANLPAERLGGLGFVEYEPGRKAVHDLNIHNSVARYGDFLPLSFGTIEQCCQPLLLDRKLVFIGSKFDPSAMRDLYLLKIQTDGSTEAKEVCRELGRVLGWNVSATASPDAKWLYIVTQSGGGHHPAPPVVLRAPLDGSKPVTVYLGDPKAPGSDNRHFMDPCSVACDSQGRLYVCDQSNNRIQIFSADGTCLKTLKLDRPEVVRIHPKTGALYVLQQARVEGRSLARLTKFGSFDSLTEEFHADEVGGHELAIDAWTPKTRLWLGVGGTVRILEEDGKAWRTLTDLREEAKKEEGGNYLGQWGGGGSCSEGKVVCDPVRERVYAANAYFFDLKSGAFLFETPSSGDDVAFDKRGYMHTHFNPGFYQQGVGRLDPGRATERPWFGGETRKPWTRMVFKECPYDYGVEGKKDRWSGIIQTRCQPGAKFFQDGLGVSMQGDLVVQSNIYHVPKMAEEGIALADAGNISKTSRGEEFGGSEAGLSRYVQEMEKQGESVYSIRRQPGIPLAGATIWTYERNGELRGECSGTVGGLINGVQMDEGGHIYFVTNQPRAHNEKPFLYDRGGVFGVPDYKGDNRYPFTGTLIKAGTKGLKMLRASAPVALDERPNRPPDLFALSFHNIWNKGSWCWAEGAEWLYAGASPIVCGECSCPTQRFHLDWFKRSFVSESYRHSFGVLDTAGNLILHLGRYGNYDSGFGAQSKLPLGGDNISVFIPRFISGTDNYLCFSDWGERLVVLKIGYQAEESVPIGTK